MHGIEYPDPKNSSYQEDNCCLKQASYADKEDLAVQQAFSWRGQGKEFVQKAQYFIKDHEGAALQGRKEGCHDQDARGYKFKVAVSYTHLRAHETVLDLVCRLLLEKKKKKT